MIECEITLWVRSGSIKRNLLQGLGHTEWMANERLVKTVKGSGGMKENKKTQKDMDGQRKGLFGGWDERMMMVGVQRH